MIKSVRNLLICLFAFVSLVSTGFGMWYFIDAEKSETTLQGSNVSVEIAAPLQIDNVDFVSPLELGYTKYGIALSSDFKNPGDLYGGISFAPSVNFIYSNYELVDPSEKIYYYFSFTSTNPIFANEESGALLFDTSMPGHSLENKIELNIRDEGGNLIFKTDEHGAPILDAEEKYIYEISQVFAPVFKYKSGAKPTNIEEYKALLNLLQGPGESVLSLNIVAE